MNSRNDTTVDPSASTALQLDHGSMLDTIEAMWPQIAPLQGARLREAVRSVPEREWSDRPRILLAMAASHRSIGSTSRSAALPWFRAVEKSIHRDPATPLDVRAGYRIQLAATCRSLGDLVRARTLLEEARTMIEQDDSLEISRRIDLSASFSLQLGLVRIHLGAYDESLFALSLAEGLADEHLSTAETVECHSALGFVSFLVGDFAAAERHADLALQHAEGSDLGRSAFAALAHLTRYHLLVERDSSTTDHDAQLRDLRIAARGSDWEPLSLYAEAIGHQAAGASIEALDVLGRAARLTESFTGELALDAGARILRAEALRTLGELDAAREAIRDLAPGQHHVTCAAPVSALSSFSVGDPQAALDALESCLALGDLHSTRAMASVYAIAAASHADLGHDVASAVAFDRALLLAAQRDTSWPFRILPQEVAERLFARAADRLQPGVVRALLERLSTSTHDETVPLADPLSERELVIVRHLATGATLSQIGSELFISVNTVKSHVRSIYRKLSSTSRREAIARAVQLGLTDPR